MKRSLITKYIRLALLIIGVGPIPHSFASTHSLVWAAVIRTEAEVAVVAAVVVEVAVAGVEMVAQSFG